MGPPACRRGARWGRAVSALPVPALPAPAAHAVPGTPGRPPAPGPGLAVAPLPRDRACRADPAGGGAGGARSCAPAAASALASAVCRAFQTASGSGPRPHGALRLDTPVLQAPDPVPHGPEPRALLSARTGPAPRAPCSRVWLAALSQHGRKGEQRQTEPSPLASQQGLRPDFPHQRLISSASDIKPIQKQCFSRKHLSQGTDIAGKETEDTDTERTRWTRPLKCKHTVKRKSSHRTYLVDAHQSTVQRAEHREGTPRPRR
ncbi:translation initiation factor IF-2-like [Equus quagga]|uniref:translation initiation factor IF-2-like n=1 Tax=Equus quagga TaxID=89248 RepID=UPI001EE1D6DB|nr:translation initiation factor IF-2-like [Equus quagga]